jgi:ankyrin repeat protein
VKDLSHHQWLCFLIECFKLLVEYGANLNIHRRRDGTTPLHWAVVNGRFKHYVLLIRDLIHTLINSNTLDFGGQSALQKLFGGPETEAVEDYKYRALAFILNSSIKTKVNKVLGGEPKKLIHLAVARRSAIATGLLFSKGADINAKNSRGLTPLLLASNQWHGELTADQLAMLDILLGQEKIDVNITGGPLKRTALHHAVVVGASSAVDWLVSRGSANVGLKDKDGNDSMALAIKHADQYRVESHAAIMGTLCKALSKNDWQVEEDECIIRKALRDISVMEDILTSGMAPDTLYKGLPLLHHAILLKNTDMVASLLEKGSSVTRKNLEGEDAIGYATSIGAGHILKLLIKARDAIQQQQI